MIPATLAASLIAEMVSHFESHETFGEVGNFLAGKDPYFTFRDWMRVFRTVPSLRRYLLPALVWNLICKKREVSGYSERFQPGRKYNFSYRSFCTDFLVWESIASAASHFKIALPDSLRGRLENYFSLAFQNCYAVPVQDRLLPMFSYYPRHDHLVPHDNSVYKMFFSRDDNVPDIDTTSLILGSAIPLIGALGLSPTVYQHDEQSMLDFLALMRDHVYGLGRYGQKSLSYENGILPGDQGVLTWVFDDHNELDPTSNVNVLNFLFRIRRIRPDAPLEEIAALTRPIINFLSNHARNETYFDQRFQSYYPLGPSLLFWRRMYQGYLALDEKERAILDAQGRLEEVNERLAKAAGKIYRAEGGLRNPYDILTAAPFLYERNVMRAELRDWLGSGEQWVSHFRKNHYEIFHLRYPSKIICAPIMVPYACLLDFLTHVDKVERSQFHLVGTSKLE